MTRQKDDPYWMYRPDALWDAPNVQASLKKAFDAGRASGLSEAEVVEKLDASLTEGLPDLIDEFAAQLRASLKKAAPAMLAEHGRLVKRLERRLQWMWSDALDLLYEVLVACEEAGRDFSSAFTSSAQTERDYRFQALLNVHARACLTTSEIHALLRTGHGRGALARWRTLHELDVVSTILGEGDEELSRRFLLHGAAEAYEDAVLHEKHRERIGRPPWPTEELEALRRQHTEAISLYGAKFPRAWRWADPVTSPEPAEFWRLEQIAGLDHLRPDFRTASHTVHAGSRGSALSQVFFRGKHLRLTGPSNMLLTEPGHGAALSLSHATRCLVVRGRPEGPSVIMLAALQAIDYMTEEIGVALTKCEKFVNQLEQDFLRASERGAPFVLLHELRSIARRRMWRARRLARELMSRAQRRSHHQGRRSFARLKARGRNNGS